MKIGRFEEFINERNSSGVLYHFTSFKNLVDILRSNMLIAKPHTLSKDRPNEFTVSMTRDSRLHTMNPGIFGTDIRLCFDARKLATKYKIVPYRWSHFYGNPETDLTESEEAIITGKDGLQNMKSYILSATILPTILKKHRTFAGSIDYTNSRVESLVGVLGAILDQHSIKYNVE